MSPFSRANGVLVLALLAVFALACSDSGPTSPASATVRFSYTSLPALQTGGRSAARFPLDCVRQVNRPHLHVSWKEPRFYMDSLGERKFAGVVGGAPVNTEISVAVADPNACRENAAGRVTLNVFANGVRLTRVIPSSAGPRLAFRVRADGTVLP